MSVDLITAKLRSRGIQLAGVLVVIAVLAVFTYPVGSIVKGRGYIVTDDCLSNEKQIMAAMLQYAADYNAHMPSSVRSKSSRTGPVFITWDGLILPRVKAVSVFKCPDDVTKGTRSYSFNDQSARIPDKHNSAGVELARISPAGKYVAICDWHCDANNIGASMYATMCRAPKKDQQFHRGNAGNNYGFFDGHVEYRPFGKIEEQHFVYPIVSVDSAKASD